MTWVIWIEIWSNNDDDDDDDDDINNNGVNIFKS